jgi:hypothetical protein
MRRTTLLALLTALIAAIVPAQAQSRQATGAWATVNVCDTLESPNQIGIRGSMPGIKRKSRMTMRFRVQYLDDGRWRFIRSGADSGQQPIANAKGGEHDSGWTFEFRPPASGGAYQLRGVVNFTWKRKGKVVKRQRRVTTGNHPGTAGAEPPDFSAATCAIA